MRLHGCPGLSQRGGDWSGGGPRPARRPQGAGHRFKENGAATSPAPWQTVGAGPVAAPKHGHASSPVVWLNFHRNFRSCLAQLREKTYFWWNLAGLQSTT